MTQPKSTMEQQVAQVVMDSQQQTTSHIPKAATMVLSQDTLVVTLHEAFPMGNDEEARRMESAVRIAGPLDRRYRAWCLILPNCAVYDCFRGEAKTRIRPVVKRLPETPVW